MIIFINYSRLNGHMKEKAEGIKTGVIKYYEKKKPIRIIKTPVKSEIRNKLRTVKYLRRKMGRIVDS